MVVLKGKRKTLNELAHLKDSGFGRPWPRHGLKLLHWFANECISFENNNEIYSKCDPAQKDYGFHQYYNVSITCDDDDDKLLPEVDILYYVVGNLHPLEADQLPKYVLEYKSKHRKDSNTDRIIVSFDEGYIEKVYVTQHIDNSKYDPKATYRISKGLLMIISRMDLDTFLCKTGYSQPVQSPDTATINVPVVSPDNLLPVNQDVSVDMEAPPAASTIDTKIQIDEAINTPKQEHSENVSDKKGWYTWFS